VVSGCSSLRMVWVISWGCGEGVLSRLVIGDPGSCAIALGCCVVACVAVAPERWPLVAKFGAF